MQWLEGLYWFTCRKLPASREREKAGKKVNGQKIDIVTRLPMDRVRKAQSKGEREKIDGGTWRGTGGRGVSEHFDLWGQASGQYPLNKIYTKQAKTHTQSHSTTDVHTFFSSQRNTPSGLSLVLLWWLGTGSYTY